MAVDEKNELIETLPVLGMTCASCANSAESIVKRQEGVVNASVNFATGNLTVTYLSDVTSRRKLQQAVQSVGYDLLISDETEQKETIEAINEKAFKLRSEEHTSELQSRE